MACFLMGSRTFCFFVATALSAAASFLQAGDSFSNSSGALSKGARIPDSTYIPAAIPTPDPAEGEAEDDAGTAMAGDVETPTRQDSISRAMAEPVLPTGDKVPSGTERVPSPQKKGTSALSINPPKVLEAERASVISPQLLEKKSPFSAASQSYVRDAKVKQTLAQGEETIADDESRQAVEDEPVLATDEEKAPPVEAAQASEQKESLQPIADPDNAGPIPLEAASFNGVVPGTTTMEEVEKSWGMPKEVIKQKERMIQLYSVEPFDRVELTFEKNVVTSLVIRFDKPYPAEKIAQLLQMASIRPVLVLNELGEVLGQAYPERGVLFAFEPFEKAEDKSKPSMRVTHLILEPLSAETFVLRAETMLESRRDSSQRDLEQALELQPGNARANWLLSRVLISGEEYSKALPYAKKAVEQEEKNARYQITLAQCLSHLGQIKEAIEIATTAAEISEDTPHLQARAYCLLGDILGSASKPDFRKALALHTQAIQIADSVSDDPHPAIRSAAKEVLVDAHLGAAVDIAWGEWKEKEKAVSRWLERALLCAEDLQKNEGGTLEQRFRAQTRVLAACVGVRGAIDPQPWIDDALAQGEKLITKTENARTKARIQWELGMALYDAVQIYQMRNNHEIAMKYGEEAVKYLELGHAQRDTPVSSYLLGRIYFRLGAVKALKDRDHVAAIEWFDKALPLLRQPPSDALDDAGQHGETFVSMGVSYWQAGRHEQAVEVTQTGIALLEKVAAEKLGRGILAVPYKNLSAMHRAMGSADEADKCMRLASEAKNQILK